MEKFFVDVAWPVVALLICLTALVLFRGPITALINRTKKVGKGGLETYDGQTTQKGDETKGLDEFLHSFDSPILLEVEQGVLNDLKTRKIESPEDREKALVRALAASNVAIHFERAANSIWASQLACLRFLNSSGLNTDIAEAVTFYDHAKYQYPEFYKDYDFDRWLGFLREFNLVGQENSKIFITIAGREFLKYLIALGKPEPLYG